MKKVTILSIAVLLIGIITVLCIVSREQKANIDPTAVNDIEKSLAEEWDSLDNNRLPCRQYGLDYTVFNNDGRLLWATRQGLSQNMSEAISNRDTIVDITNGDRIYGKLIINNESVLVWKQYRNSLMLLCVGIILFLIVLLIAYSVYIDRSIFRPFRKLKDFAAHVAAGNLDIPLKMDRGNMFGAFTESFDLMRDELYKARESEMRANESKKELVATLSHDIKTPVASIKAVSEIMMIKTHDEEAKRQLAVIDAKADQIDILITNMFNATLEELQKLSVTVTEQPSTILTDLIKNADYNSRASFSSVPECIILADVQRLSQVIDNIISNSYKYAGTSLNVTIALTGRELEVKFEDYGHGVPPDELTPAVQ